MRTRFIFIRKAAPALALLAAAVCLHAGDLKAGAAKPPVSPHSLPGIRDAKLPPAAVAVSSSTPVRRKETAAPAEVSRSTAPAAAPVAKSTAAAAAVEAKKPAVPAAVPEVKRSTVPAAVTEVTKSTSAAVPSAVTEAAAAVPAEAKAGTAPAAPAAERLTLSRSLPVVPLSGEDATKVFFKALEKATGENPAPQAASGGTVPPAPRPAPAGQAVSRAEAPAADAVAPSTAAVKEVPVPTAAPQSTAAAPVVVSSATPALTAATTPLSGLPVAPGATEQIQVDAPQPAVPGFPPAAPETATVPEAGGGAAAPEDTLAAIPERVSSLEEATEMLAPLSGYPEPSAVPAPPAEKAPLSAGESTLSRPPEKAPAAARPAPGARAAVHPVRIPVPPAAAPAAAPKKAAAEQRAAGTLMRAHRVTAGETLPSLAARYYGDNSDWVKIYEANKDRIEKGSLHDGQILIIP